MAVHGHGHEVKPSIRIYLIIFAALGVLTAITVAASKLQLTIAAGIILALIIASVKGSLVAAYFMHLTHEKKLLYGLLVLCAFFFLELLLIPMWQTGETKGLVGPVYRQIGEAPPPAPTITPAYAKYAAHHAGHESAAGDEHKSEQGADAGHGH